jgi:hypothetical protein
MVLFALGLVFFLPGPRGLCEPNPQNHWDGDGGYTHDYSQIPRLEWSGPGAPGTYQEYLERKGSSPFQIQHVYTSSLSRGGRAEKALILVNTVLYPGIKARLDIYVQDLVDEGYLVEVYQTMGGTPVDLKTFILSHVTDLVGCAFVGDLPVAWCELEVWGHEEFPCDLYYMDLDGFWDDTDSDGMFDVHNAGTGDEGPEIFIGHIDTSMMSGNEAAVTNDYLDKLHEYKMGKTPLTDFACSYTEDDWISFMDIRTDIKYAYPDFDDIPAPATNRHDYVDSRVPNPTYEFVQMCCHSSSILHAFTRGGNAYNHEIKAAVPFAAFFNLFACSSLRFTTTDFLGGSYIYDTSQTSVGVIGSTKTGSMLVFHAFYKPFGQYKSFGQAFRDWFNYIAPYDNEERAWHYGMTIAGDPFLAKLKPALFLKFPEGLPQGYHPPGPETKMTLEIESASQNYVAGTGTLHYRFDPNDPYTVITVTPMGGDLYGATLPNTKPGCKPEFYFSAQGDGGATIYSPFNAPADVYSFDVYFAITLMEDDFEGDKGWTVQNINLDDGPWERGVPIGGGDRGDPPTDFDGSGKCYLTDNVDGNSDVDGGPTILTSPMINLSFEDTFISYARWHYNDDNNDWFTVEISNDDGNIWEKVEQVTHTVEWNTVTFKVSDFVTPTPWMRVRFSAIDQPNDSVTEAGLDAFKVERLLYDATLWADAYAASAALGAVVNYSMDAGTSNANRTYLVMGSLTGTEPGFNLPGGENMPINWDAFTNLVLASLGSPVFQNFMGTLDGSGQAAAVFNSMGPLDPVLIGQTMSFAYLLGGPPGWDFTSNPVDLTIDP